MAVRNLLNVEEAAEVIGCTPQHVRLLLRTGTLEGTKLSPRAWVIDRREAERYRDVEHNRGRPRSAIAAESA